MLCCNSTTSFVGDAHKYIPLIQHIRNSILEISSILNFLKLFFCEFEVPNHDIVPFCVALQGNCQTTP